MLAERRALKRRQAAVDIVWQVFARSCGLEKWRRESYRGEIDGVIVEVRPPLAGDEEHVAVVRAAAGYTLAGDARAHRGERLWMHGAGRAVVNVDLDELPPEDARVDPREGQFLELLRDPRVREALAKVRGYAEIYCTDGSVTLRTPCSGEPLAAGFDAAISTVVGIAKAHPRSGYR
jgi:hypothetical protein